MPPLSGIRVIEWADGIAAAFCGKVLADLGAEVIKLEPATGDGLRREGPFFTAPSGQRESALFAALNLGKRSVALSADTRDVAGVQDLLATANVLLFAPPQGAWATMTSERIQGEHPALALVSITPHGEFGPGAGRLASDLTMQHGAGFAWHQAMPVRDPEQQPPVACADREGPLAAGLNAAISALWALLAAPEGTAAKKVDFSVEDFYAQLLVDQVAAWSRGRRDFSRQREPGETPTIGGGIVWLLMCRDGAVMISPREQHQWDRWMLAIGSPAWSADKASCGSRSGRQANAEKLQGLMQQWSQSRSRAEVAELAQGARVACFPISTPADLLDNAQMEHRKFFDFVDLGRQRRLPVPGLPFQMCTSHGENLARASVRKAPTLGDANAELFGRRPDADPVVSPRSPGLQRPVLQGLRVLDFSWVMAGPMATKALGAMGAEVIKVESSTRPEYTERGGFFAVINNNKKSCAINITDPRGQDLVRRLAAKSDVVVENFSAGVLDKYGLGAKDLMLIKPDLIYVSASGMGRSGPLRDMLAYGTLLQGYSGRAGMVGPANVRLEAMGIMPAWTDPVTAWWETLSILAALYQRERTGAGAYIDLSMFESTVALLPEALLREALHDPAAQPGGNREPGAAPAGCFRAKGADAWFALAIAQEPHWQGLCRAIGRDDWLQDERLADRDSRILHKTELDSAIAAWACSVSAAEAERILQAHGVPAARTRSIADLVRDPHLSARGVYACLADGSLTSTLPWRDAQGWRGGARPAPALGQDNAYVFSDLLGMDAATVAELMADKIIG